MEEMGMKLGMDSKSRSGWEVEPDSVEEKNLFGALSMTRPSACRSSCKSESFNLHFELVSSAPRCAQIPLAQAKATLTGRRNRFKRTSAIPWKLAVHLACMRISH